MFCGAHVLARKRENKISRKSRGNPVKKLFTPDHTEHRLLTKNYGFHAQFLERVLCSHEDFGVAKSVRELRTNILGNHFCGGFSSRSLSSAGGKETRESRKRMTQCSFVYPYPSVSAFAGRHSDYDLSKNSDQNSDQNSDSVLTRERRNSVHGLSFWGREAPTMV